MPLPLQIQNYPKSGETSVEVPLLENGDRLSRPEFERRYHAMSALKKAELIEGVVYMSSPVRIDRHGRQHAQVMTWLGTYWAATPVVDLGDNATTRLDLDNEPQPDALLRIASAGTSSISDDGYVVGAPELVVEIAASSVSYDLHDKLRVYRRNGVQEYLVWKIANHKIDWFSLNEGEYILLEPDAVGIIRSQVFPGLWLASHAMLEGNLAEVLMILQQGLATAEHRDFVQRLKGD